MTPSEALTQLLETREALYREYCKTPPSDRERKALEEQLEYAKRDFDDAILKCP